MNSLAFIAPYGPLSLKTPWQLRGRQRVWPPTATRAAPRLFWPAHFEFCSSQRCLLPLAVSICPSDSLCTLSQSSRRMHLPRRTRDRSCTPHTERVGSEATTRVRHRSTGVRKETDPPHSPHIQQLRAPGTQQNTGPVCMLRTPLPARRHQKPSTCREGRECTSWTRPLQKLLLGSFQPDKARSGIQQQHQGLSSVCH